MYDAAKPHRKQREALSRKSRFLFRIRSLGRGEGHPPQGRFPDPTPPYPVLPILLIPIQILTPYPYSLPPYPWPSPWLRRLQLQKSFSSVPSLPHSPLFHSCSLDIFPQVGRVGFLDLESYGSDAEWSFPALVSAPILCSFFFVFVCMPPYPVFLILFILLILFIPIQILTPYPYSLPPYP